MRWLIAYDVACPRRLLRVYRFVCGYALPLQNSVFLLVGHREDFECCMQGLMSLLDPKEDDLRAYCLPQGGVCRALGGDWMPEGVWLSIVDSG
ncbi:hypothetical protein [Neisseria sp. S1]|uniref:CRISPR-associated endonuclease Cas2 n=1 Tax=Neisseria sp. S1 TaxID=3318354 RepID=UPI003A87ACEE